MNATMAIIRHADGMTPPIPPTAPDDLPGEPPPSDPPPRPWYRRRAGIIVGVAVVLAAYVISQSASGPRKTALRDAYETCGYVGQIADGDRTLFLDMAGKEANSGTLTVTNIACVLNKLDAPSYVIHAMDQTRALDGRQSESWGKFDASWSYHPDNGLDVLIREH